MKQQQTFTAGDQWTAGDLEGVDVCDATGDKIGTVEGAYIDAQGTAARYLAVRTGWLGTKRHIVPLDDVQFDRTDNVLRLPYDRGRLESGPTIGDEPRTLSPGDEADIYRYYGRPGYWEAVDWKQTTPSATPEIAQADVAEAMAEADVAARGDIPGSRVRWYAH